MGVHRFSQEIKCKVPAKRMFKVFVTETHDVLPKILPHAVKSVEILQGDGGVGTIMKTNFAPDIGLPFSYSKHKIDSFDVEKHEGKYTLIEGAMLGGNLESVFYDQKHEDTPDGGSIIKMVSEWRMKGDAELNEEIVKAEQEKYIRFTKQIEEYLLAHPEVCA